MSARPIESAGGPEPAAQGNDIESFNARLGDELLNGEIFYSNNQAPRASSGYKPPAPEVSRLHPPRGRLRYANRLPRHAGATTNLKLTFHLDHSTGADHLR
jgi:hypothetical protein